MATYMYKVYSERDRPYDRYARDVITYAKGTVSATSRNDAIEKVILKVGMLPQGDILEITTQKGTKVATLLNTERPIEPWGRQWTDVAGKGRMDSSTRNYHIHNGHVYYVMGMGYSANRLNPVKKKA